jgi:Rha family phage regulatory protein
LNTNDDLTAFIARDGAELITDSRAVALAFRKRHKNVLRTINRMCESKRPEIVEHYRLNFEPVIFEFANGKGGTQQAPAYKMTAKGMSELAMSFTGDDARVVRIRFINAFEEVANRLAQAEKSITERLFELERRELPSQVKGKVGSLLMNARRREKPVFAKERASLEALAQPPLIGLTPAPALELVGSSRNADNGPWANRAA